LRRVGRLKLIALDRRAADDRVPSHRPPGRELGESGVVIVTFADFTEPVLLMLRRPRSANAPDDSVRRQHLKRRADVHAPRVEGFGVWAGGGKRQPGHRPAGPFFPGSSDRREKRPA
jgi:hypothetical protein